MNQTRREFLATSAALLAAPLVPVPVPTSGPAMVDGVRLVSGPWELVNVSFLRDGQMVSCAYRVMNWGGPGEVKPGEPVYLSAEGKAVRR